MAHGGEETVLHAVQLFDFLRLFFRPLDFIQQQHALELEQNAAENGNTGHSNIRVQVHIVAFLQRRDPFGMHFSQIVSQEKHYQRQNQIDVEERPFEKHKDKDNAHDKPEGGAAVQSPAEEEAYGQDQKVGYNDNQAAAQNKALGPQGEEHNQPHKDDGGPQSQAKEKALVGGNAAEQYGENGYDGHPAGQNKAAFLQGAFPGKRQFADKL